MEHVLERTQILPGEPAEVFEFFADAFNLEDITPPWLGFRIVTPRPIAMREGALIEYRLKLHRVPIRWLTRIEAWEPGVRFVDAQIRGPYKLWHHTHTFEPHAGGTLVRDRVRYEMPAGAARRTGPPAGRARATSSGSSTIVTRSWPCVWALTVRAEYNSGSLSTGADPVTNPTTPGPGFYGDVAPNQGRRRGAAGEAVHEVNVRMADLTS